VLIIVGADGARDGLVWMKQDFPLLFSPNQADRQAAAQFSASGAAAAVMGS
jgi:hypothetical protein